MFPIKKFVIFFLFFNYNFFYFQVNHLKFCQDKYLVYTFIKALSTILSASEESVFCQRIQALLEDIKDNLFIKSNTNVLDFFSNLAQHNFKSYSTDFNIQMCNNISSKTVNLFGG